ncbi:hyalin-like [Ptychodera flava]|uniref:hyalin-like n=1 Tax=Ptychodera flava TaxID=63121 RepID=UPI00396A7F07
MVLGQDQDIQGGGYEENQAFIGSFTEFNMWSKALNDAEVQGITVDCTAEGDVFTWNIGDLRIHGNVSLTYEDICDSENPNIVCPPDTHVTALLGNPSAKVIWPMTNATDDSGMVQELGSHEPGDNFNIGATAVHYEASDPSGNTASCSFTVTVEDTENPHIICPPDATVTASLGNPTTQVIWPMPKASDNSGTVQVLGSHEPGDNFNIGVTVVHYEASDLSGNTASCSFIVTAKGVVADQARKYLYTAMVLNLFILRIFYLIFGRDSGYLNGLQ